MNELKLRGVKSHAINSPLRRLLRMILSVAYHRVSDGRKLNPDLVLQPGHQRDPHQRSAAKPPFNLVAKFSPHALLVALLCQPLKHSYFPKIVDECSLIGGELSANDGQILPNGRVPDELFRQLRPVRLGFGKEQNPGSETVNAVHHKGLLLLPLQLCGKQRQCGGHIGALHRHCCKPGRFIQGHDGIVFIENGELPCLTRPPSTMLCGTAMVLVWKFLHCAADIYPVRGSSLRA